MKAIIALEDGRIFEGRAFGSCGERTGEVVFNARGRMMLTTYPWNLRKICQREKI